MLRTLMIYIAAVLTPTLTLARSPMDPPAVVSKFGHMMGTWEGSCIARISEDGRETRLGSLMTVKTILDGNFVQKDARMDAPVPNAPATLSRIIYAYDRQSQSFVGFAINNMGTSGHHTLYWTPDGKVITTRTARGHDGPVMSISVAGYGEDSAESEVRRSIAGGPFISLATTSHRRSKRSILESEITTARAAVLPTKAIPQQRTGTWRITGTMSPFPGEPVTEIDAELAVRPVFGGHATMWTIKNEPVSDAAIAFQCTSYFQWNKEENCHTKLTLLNSGNWYFSEGGLTAERTMVYTGRTFVKGVPVAFRTIHTWSDDGRTAKLTSDYAAGDAASALFQDVKMTWIGEFR